MREKKFYEGIEEIEEVIQELNEETHIEVRSLLDGLIHNKEDEAIVRRIQVLMNDNDYEIARYIARKMDNILLAA